MAGHGNKVRREVLLRPDLDAWVSEMMRKPPGWSRNAVVEYCIEEVQRREAAGERADALLGEVKRLVEVETRVLEAVERLRSFSDYTLWLRFQPEGAQPATYEEWLDGMEARARE